MATVKKAKGTAVASWDEELAKAAAEATEMEQNSGGGQFFSIRAGVLSWQDQPMKDNEMAVIILDTIMENVYYTGDFDSDNPQPPTCFAFGRNEEEMAPHKVVVEAGNSQNDVCNGCEWNEFGSADKGRGKACKNTRRLAMIPAGKFAKSGEFEFIEDVEHYEKSEVGFMKLPVTSVKGYSSFVKQVAGTLGRPPFGIVTKVSVVPDQNSQFKVLFEPLMKVPDELMAVIIGRNKEAKTLIDFPYQAYDEEAEAPAKKGAKTSKPVNRTKQATKPAKRKY